MLYILVYLNVVFFRLLVCNPPGRLSAEEGLQHGYFLDLDPAVKNDPNVLSQGR